MKTTFPGERKVVNLETLDGWGGGLLRPRTEEGGMPLALIEYEAHSLETDGSRSSRRCHADKPICQCT